MFVQIDMGKSEYTVIYYIYRINIIKQEYHRSVKLKHMQNYQFCVQKAINKIKHNLAKYNTFSAAPTKRLLATRD